MVGAYSADLADAQHPGELRIAAHANSRTPSGSSTKCAATMLEVASHLRNGYGSSSPARSRSAAALGPHLVHKRR